MNRRTTARTLVATALVAALTTTAVTALATTASADPPAPPGVTAADEVAYLAGLTGQRTLSGQQGGANADPGQWVRKVHDITGVYPAVWNGDFGFSQNDIDHRQTVVDYAEAQWAAGTLPGLMMHACRPDVATCSFEGGASPVKGSHLSDSEWSALLTDGTALNTDYKHKLDQFVPYFQQLKDAGIPVLFRPLHEMNEGWAWWGGRPGSSGSAALFRLTHDYLAAKGLDNIVWVWAPKDVQGGAASAASYYPGDAYVDVVGLDVWNQKFPSTDWYQALQAIAGSKPMALAEVGSVPQPAQLASQPKWVYWNVWMNWLTDPSYNTNASIKAGYYDARTVNQGVSRSPPARHPRPTPRDRSPAWAAGASTWRAGPPPTGAPSSSGRATAVRSSSGPSGPTARSERWASASTSPARAPRTARSCSCGTATAPARSSGPKKRTGTC
ncbi:hypothetical protein GCM10025864_17980 [Luteimicrobium album]|uniref:GH26 domain-containing protein n=1 Tax=Luteimicrobium album TaxID=1054550 RepID=A0ABQ6I002_9MICO|nr:hypothetical protein GCM10025864_17980 [Luteimicrobium album]